MSELKPAAGIGTLCVQAGYSPKRGEPRQIPIVQSTTFKYETSAQMGKLFDLEESGYFYTRLQNPTVDYVAAKIAALEGGVGAILTSSGQAANFFACFNICETGGHIVSLNNIYGGTFNLLGTSFKKAGIDVTFVPLSATDEQLNAAFRDSTRLVFAESLSNPGVEILDIERIARIAHAHGVPLVVDNTFPTPVHCRPIEFGADIVTHSTTKYMDGHGVSVGGAVVDGGTFDWAAYPDKYPGLCTPDESYHGLTYTEKFGKAAYVTKLVTHLMRDFGSTQSPQNAFYINLGLQTLHLRVARHNSSALKVASFLKDNPALAWMHFPELAEGQQKELQLKYLPDGSCGVIAFGLKGGRERAAKFIDSLSLVTIETHVADCYTCILHPASHTHRQLSDSQLEAAGIPADLIRLSIGLEDPEDIIADIKQAIEKSNG